MLVITKKPKVENQGKQTFSLSLTELGQIQAASKDFPVKIEVLSTNNELLKTITRSKFKNLVFRFMNFNGEKFYVADYSKC